MHFLDPLLSSSTSMLREKIIQHPLWAGMQQGSLEKEKIGLFALQDFWLVQQAPTIDKLLFDSIQDTSLKMLLKQPVEKKHQGRSLLIYLGEGVGLSEKDFEHIEPLAGCAALTTFFFWAIATKNDLEKVAAVYASIGIFSEICMMVYQPLIEKYGLTSDQVAFFTAHEGNMERMQPLEKYIIERSQTDEAKKGIDNIVRLSHEFEILFYDTIMKFS